MLSFLFVFILKSESDSKVILKENKQVTYKKKNNNNNIRKNKKKQNKRSFCKERKTQNISLGVLMSKIYSPEGIVKSKSVR